MIQYKLNLLLTGMWEIVRREEFANNAWCENIIRRFDNEDKARSAFGNFKNRKT